jgi:hypothetical protein
VGLDPTWWSTYTGRVSAIALVAVDALADDLAVDVSVCVRYLFLSYHNLLCRIVWKGLV